MLGSFMVALFWEHKIQDGGSKMAVVYREYNVTSTSHDDVLVCYGSHIKENISKRAKNCHGKE